MASNFNQRKYLEYSRNWKVLCDKRKEKNCALCKSITHIRKSCPNITYFFCGKNGHIKKICWLFFLYRNNKMMKLISLIQANDSKKNLEKPMPWEKREKWGKLQGAKKISNCQEKIKQPIEPNRLLSNKAGKQKANIPLKKTNQEKRLKWLRGKKNKKLTQKPWIKTEKKTTWVKTQIYIQIIHHFGAESTKQYLSNLLKIFFEFRCSLSTVILFI